LPDFRKDKASARILTAGNLLMPRVNGIFNEGGKSFFAIGRFFMVQGVL
jgi:hypothetical protein